jgi:hypothetical protein
MAKTVKSFIDYCNHCKQPYTARRLNSLHCSSRCRKAAYNSRQSERRIRKKARSAHERMTVIHCPMDKFLEISMYPAEGEFSSDAINQTLTEGHWVPGMIFEGVNTGKRFVVVGEQTEAQHLEAVSIPHTAA